MQRRWDLFDVFFYFLINTLLFQRSCRVEKVVEKQNSHVYTHTHTYTTTKVHRLCARGEHYYSGRRVHIILLLL